MKIVFDKCSEAVDYTAKNSSYAIFHSKENNPNLNIHTHECCEILLCIGEGKNFLIDDKIYRVNKNSLFIINQFEAHKITFDDKLPIDRYVLQIHPEFLFSASTDTTDLSQCFYVREKRTSNCIELDDSEAEFLVSSFKRLENENPFGDDVLKNSEIIKILVFINEKFLNYHFPSDKNQNLPLKKAVVYINEHLSEELTLDKIAKNSYISVNLLCKIFKSSLGTTVKKYIIGKRISQAKKYLISGKSVSDTAYLCGFRDYSNFIRTFTNTVGISPGKYNKKITQ